MQHRRKQSINEKSCNGIAILLLVLFVHIAPTSSSSSLQSSEIRLHCTQQPSDGSTICTFTIPSSAPPRINQELADCTEDRCVVASLRSSIVEHREKQNPTIVVVSDNDEEEESVVGNGDITRRTATTTSGAIKADQVDSSDGSTNSWSPYKDSTNKQRRRQQQQKPKRPLPNWYLDETDLDDEEYEEQDLAIEFAEWWISTGILDYAALTSEDHHDETATLTSSHQHLEEAIDYLKYAAKDLFGSSTEVEPRIRSAEMWVYVGESYLYFPESNKEAYPSAKDAFERGAKLYQVLLDEEEEVYTEIEEETKERMELKFADSLVRLGVISMDVTADAEQGSLALGDLDKYAAEIEEATNFLSAAVEMYRSQLERKDRNLDDVILGLAGALQSYGTAITMGTNDMIQATKLYEESLDNYEGLLSTKTPTREQESGGETIDDDSLVAFIAPLTQTLADMYLQLERYEESKVTYRKTMEYYKTSPELAQSIVVDVQLSTVSIDSGSSEMMNDLNPQDIIMEYEQELRYLIQEDGFQDEYYWSQKTSLHTALGAIYMGSNNLEQAVIHFTQAKESLGALSGNNDDHDILRSLADVNLNLSMALQRMGEYDDSSSTHDEAVDLYETITPKGTNPLMDGLTDLGFDDVGGAASVTMTGNHETNDAGSSTNRKEPPEGGGADDESNKGATATAKSNTREAIKAAVAERLINLDTLNSNFLNHTSVKEEL